MRFWVYTTSAMTVILYGLLGMIVYPILKSKVRSSEKTDVKTDE